MKKKVKKIHYGKELEKAAKRKGMSKVFVAKQLGCSRTFLYRILESGKFTPEKLKIVKQLIK